MRNRQGSGFVQMDGYQLERHVYTSSTPNLVRMEHSKSCNFVYRICEGLMALAVTTGQVSYKIYNVHVPKVIVT